MQSLPSRGQSHEILSHNNNNAMEPRDFDGDFASPDEIPDMVVGGRNALNGDIKFERYLRVEGSIEGQIIAPPNAKVKICEGGSYVGDICGLSAALIDGRVVGDINVDRLFLASNAEVHGDIVCKSLEIDCNAALVGRLQVSQHSVVQSNYEEDRSIIDGDLDSDDESFAASLGDDSDDDSSRQKQRNYKVVLLIMEPQVDFYANYPNSHNSNNSANASAGGSDAAGCSSPFGLMLPPPPSQTVVAAADTATATGTYRGESAVAGMSAGLAAAEEGSTLAQFISQHLDDIDEIVVTLDSHHKLHVSHSTYWVDGAGGQQQPAVNTTITLRDVEAGLWRPRKPELLEYTMDLLRQLGAQNAHYGYGSTTDADADIAAVQGPGGGIVIRPEHCLVGSQGSAILPAVHRAIGEWVDHTLRDVTYLTTANKNYLQHVKGHLLQLQQQQREQQQRQLATEEGKGVESVQPGVVGGEGQLAAGEGAPSQQKQLLMDPSQYFDLSFLEMLGSDDKLLICGQAISHCVGFSVFDVISTAMRSSSLLPQNIFMLKDATSVSALVNGISSQMARAVPLFAFNSLSVRSSDGDAQASDGDGRGSSDDRAFLRLQFSPRAGNELEQPEGKEQSPEDSASQQVQASSRHFWAAFDQSPVSVTTTADAIFKIL